MFDQIAEDFGLRVSRPERASACRDGYRNYTSLEPHQLANLLGKLQQYALEAIKVHLSFGGWTLYLPNGVDLQVVAVQNKLDTSLTINLHEDVETRHLHNGLAPANVRHMKMRGSLVLPDPDYAVAREERAPKGRPPRKQTQKISPEQAAAEGVRLTKSGKVATRRPKRTRLPDGTLPPWPDNMATPIKGKEVKRRYAEHHDEPAFSGKRSPTAL